MWYCDVVTPANAKNARRLVPLPAAQKFAS